MAASSRHPLSFSEEITSALHACFAENHYPNVERRGQLSEHTGLNDKQILQWFSNRRRRDSRGCPVRKSENFPPWVCMMLDNAFQQNLWPDDAQVKALSASAKLSVPQVRKWFRNRRHRCTPGATFWKDLADPIALFQDDHCSRARLEFEQNLCTCSCDQ